MPALTAPRTLAEIREEMAHAGPNQRRALAEMASSYFYVDTLDQPQLKPLVDEAAEIVAGLGIEALPLLLDILDTGDMKAQMVCGYALGRIGEHAIRPLIAEYNASATATRRSLILFALGKIRSPSIVEAAPLAIEAATASDAELRDTAVRALGKFAEVIRPGTMSDDLLAAFVEPLMLHVPNPNPAMRAKAVRSLGKLARFGHLRAEERETLRAICRSFLGTDENHTWDRAYIVRKEAQEALDHC